jgi:hypothetical protein
MNSIFTSEDEEFSGIVSGSHSTSNTVRVTPAANPAQR